MVLFLIDLFAGAACRPTRNVRDTWLSQLWREISGGFAAKLTLSSRAAFR